MTIESTTKAPAVVKPPARFDVVNAPEIKAEISDLLAVGEQWLVVDLADAEFVDSAALAVLVFGMKQARRAGGDLALVAPTHPDARRIFSLTRFDDVFTMVADPSELVR